MSGRGIAAVLSVAAVVAATGPARPSTDGVPAVVQLGELEKLHPAVSFDHESHVAVADGCRRCHHKKFGDPLGCGTCHTELVERKDFTHEQHEPLTNCLACHQVQTVKAMRCSHCHSIPYDTQRLHVIGLKGALHQQCMGCHRELGLDLACKTCHQKD